MRRTPVGLLALSLLVACGGPQPTHGEEASEPATAQPEPEPDSVESDPAGSPEPGNAPGCNADRLHCCQPDGSIVRPGGCMPSRM